MISVRCVIVSLDESDVFETALEHLSNQGYELFVHVPGAHQDSSGYSGFLTDYEQHDITIQGRYPDILGYSPTGRVISVEVKGDTGVLKALGQALVYQRGSHRTYVAAEESALERIRKQTRPNRIGEIQVSPSGEISVEDPPQGNTQDLLPDVKSQLDYRLGTSQSVGDIARMNLADPLHFIAPVVALENYSIENSHEVAEIISSEYGYKITQEAIRGATILGLIESGTLKLTDTGGICISFLRGQDISSLDGLADLKERVDDALYKENQIIAAYLREQFNQHSEFRALTEILDSFTDYQVTLGQVIGKTIDEYPNIFLNLFCPESKREKAETLVREESANTLSVEDWRPLIRQNIVHNFTIQLRHLGILMARTTSHAGAIDNYEPDDHHWFLSNSNSWF
jgi:hypothetical protein